MNRRINGLANLLACGALLVAAALPALAQDKAPAGAAKYACQGFAAPLNRPNLHIERTRVLPLRAKLTAADGTVGDDTALNTPPVVSLKFEPPSGPAVDKSDKLEVRDFGKGKSFVFDKEAGWKFDLGTGNLPDNGKYVATMQSGDPKEYTIDPTCTVNFNLE